ncbi:hypothetical protein F2Q69_00052176 [Brassica cretica]|uniref:Uncharacterized protein n=1 Tax=Brassica cretica TaxID=69181 RepID=A0A8S9N3V2_BRACR|nr:hypothetical protein F2Q69_00052176 [Brassica cretica]
MVFPDLRDFERLLRRLSEHSRKTSNAFYARRLPMKSSGSLKSSEVFCLKCHLNAFEYADFSDLRHILEDFWDNSSKTLGRLSKDSRKTLGRLLGKSSVCYSRRLPTKSSESLPKSSAQSGTKR